MYQLSIIIAATVLPCQFSPVPVDASATVIPSPMEAQRFQSCREFYPDEVVIPYAAYDRLSRCQAEAERIGEDRRYKAECTAIGEGK